MKRIGFVLVFAWVALRVVAQDASAGWHLVSIQPLEELIDGFDGTRAVLSPDGSSIAWFHWRNLLCIYTFADDATACLPLPEDFRLDLNESNIPVWSLDSSQIALHEHSRFFGLSNGEGPIRAIQFFNDTDIWIYDVGTQSLTNRTDDGYQEDSLEGAQPIDFLPRWNPADGELYFIRAVRNLGGEPEFSEALYRLSDGDKAEFVYDLGQSIPGTLPVYSSMAFSSDGEQLAMMVPKQSGPGAGIWLLDMTTGIVQEVVTVNELTTGMPSWYEWARFGPITWAGDNLIVFAANLILDNPLGNAQYIDLTSGAITPLVDMTDMDMDAQQAVEISAGVLLPDGNLFWYVNVPPDSTTMRVMAQTLPPEGDPVLLMEILSEEPGRTYTISSVGANGTALLFDSLLTFQHE